MTTSYDEKVQTDMEMNSAAEHHVIEISEVMNKDILCSMNKKIREQPKQLRTSADGNSCCVYRVPRSYIDSKGPNTYQPEIVSIGPYHHRKSHDSHLQMLEEHKWRYLDSLVSRTVEAEGAGLADYVKAIQSQESDARGCYSETIDLNTKEFVEMMVLDGCFIIELFRKDAGVVPVEADDPIFSMSWVGLYLERDLLKLENQIPLFVLQSLFDLSKIPGDRIPEEERGASFARLALEFFKDPLGIAAEKTDGSSKDKCPKHLLDFIRSSFIPEKPLKNMYPGPTKNRKLGTRMFPSVTELRRAGIKCKPYAEDSESMIQYYVTKLHRAVIRCISNPGDSPPKNNSFLDIKFRKHAPHGVIEMPSIKIDDVTTAFLLNCVAYEQCYTIPSKHAYFTTYAAFMDCLINTPQDVGLLCDGDVIVNDLGHEKEVVILFNKFGKDVTLDVSSCYLSKVFNDVNEYYRTNWKSAASWHVNWALNWAVFRHKYFDSPWSFISLVAAALLLLLTFAQTIFAAYGYYQSRKG